MRWLLSAALLLPTTAFAQQACEDNVVRYGQHRETSFGAIALSPGGAMGQFYERPGPMDLVGMEIYAYGFDQTECNTVGACDEAASTSAFDLRAEVFLADAEGLPAGASIVSRDITLTCRCDPSQLDNIRQQFTFPAIPLTGDYVVTVTNSDPDDTLVVRTNSFSNADGDQEDLGRHFTFPLGESVREWFPASSIVVGSARIEADADVYAHPIVSFGLDASFVVEGPGTDACVKAGRELAFSALDAIAASPIYNTDVRDGVEVSTWLFGDGASDTGDVVLHTYATSTDVTVRHTLSFIGDTETCLTLVNEDVDAVVPYYFDCDRDGFTGGVGSTYCGEPTAQGGECRGIQVPLFAPQDEGDCNDDSAAFSPGVNETCDNIDNNCDEAIDNDIDDRDVAAPFGECATDVEFCEAGNWLVDPNNVGPVPEQCDGRDEDCNGTADNGVADILTGNQTGACAGNSDACVGGDFTPSASNHQPSADMCDGLDNDCDAQTEDGANDPQLGIPCDGDDADDCDGGELICDGGSLVCSDDSQDDDCGDPDTDSDPDSDPDSDSDSDSDGDSDTGEIGPVGGTRCGCSSGPNPISLFGVGLLLLGLAVRRRS
jgi:MYXO-CTERM domain-containing protein